MCPCTSFSRQLHFKSNFECSIAYDQPLCTPRCVDYLFLATSSLRQIRSTNVLHITYQRLPLFHFERMRFCSYCVSSVATHQCNDCTHAQSTECVFCDECSEIHLKIKKYSNHSHIVLHQNETPREVQSSQKNSSTDAIERSLKAVSVSKMVTHGSRTVSRSELTSNCPVENAITLERYPSTSSKKRSNSLTLEKSLATMSDIVDAIYDHCSGLMNFTDVVEMLNFFEFSILLRDLPTFSAIIPMIFLAILVLVFLGDVVKGLGPSVAIIIAVIAFLRVMQTRKDRKQFNDIGPFRRGASFPIMQRQCSRTSIRAAKRRQASCPQMKVTCLPIHACPLSICLPFT